MHWYKHILLEIDQLGKNIAEANTENLYFTSGKASAIDYFWA